MSFNQVINKYNWNDIKSKIYSRTANDVEQALSKQYRDINDFISLISPAASAFLEPMAQLSSKLTQKHFGKTIQLFIPLYLSNDCNNYCIYCGFNKSNAIERITLSKKQILKEIEIIKQYGYKHILLVTGDNPSVAGMDYLKEVMILIRPYFSLISIEVQPLDTDEYKELINIGLHSVYIYQETYNKESYRKYHQGGSKADFDYRLETPDRLGTAGIHRIGIGNLIGLEDWRTDAFFTALHVKYLEKKYWKTKYSISFPRLRPHEGVFVPPYSMTDKELVQLICAYRIFNGEVELSLSVRESSKFRDNAIKLGITSMSAGSRTEPGGYSERIALRQFEVHDHRKPAEIVEMIKSQGYEAIWKDWDKNFFKLSKANTQTKVWQRD
ncbi:MAG: 2-iminoacetate synthase ThiH [Bacteroidia bacterium]|nr:2-iminoacetate synthase ThiH [Bacteroidia bacterium]